MATITGSSGNDVLSGADGDTVYGLGGNDQITGGFLLFGGDGDDTLTASASSNYSFLDGGAGNDVLNGNGNPFAVAFYYDAPSAVHVDLSMQGVAQNTGGAGTDTLNGIHIVVGSTFNDTLIGGSGDDGLVGGPGNDILNGGGGFNLADYSYDTIGGVTVDLALTGAQNTGTMGLDTLSNIQAVGGSEFDDTLSGDANANLLIGQSGNDTLDGRGGDDTLKGGPGIDTATYWDAHSAVTVSLGLQGSGQATGGAGTDTLTGIENLTGSAFNDTLTGDSGSNLLQGLAGADTLDGGPGGDDTLDGGLGNNTASFASQLVGVYVDVGGGQAVPYNGSGWTDRLINIINVTGSSHSDYLVGDGNANILQGGAGDDTLFGGSGNDKLGGGPGDDTLYGGTGINTATYNDASSAVTVNLTISGPQNTHGAGFDALYSIQNVSGSAYGDTLTGDGYNNVLTGNGGDDTLHGGAGNDTLLGSQGDDVIFGGQGNDSLDGGAGNDILAGGAGADTLNGGLGSDTASYSDAGSAVTVDLNVQGVVQSTGGGGNDTLLGIENVIGSNFNDTLKGDAGGNVISGGTGADTIIGGGGADTLYGGAGADHFVFTSIADSGVSPKARDQIMDFSHGDGDKIDLSAISPSFVLVGSFTHAADQLIQVAQTGGYLVEGDVNGDGKADFSILVEASTTLVSTDFIL